MSVQRHPDKFAGRTVLIVAGTGGIGRGVASALVSRGCKVILTSTRQEKLDKVVSELKSLYPELKADVTGYVLNLSGDEVENDLKRVIEQMSRDGITHLDHLIFTAGDPLSMMSINDIQADSWAKVSQVRISSQLLCIKHLLPLIKAAGTPSVDNSPSITFTGGAAGSKPIPGGWTLICMLAAALHGGTRVLALDLAPIRVNLVEPGLVDTDLWAGMDEEAKKGLEARGKSMPTGRVGDVRDVAESYCGLLADGNITGAIIKTNSGSLLV